MSANDPKRSSTRLQKLERAVPCHDCMIKENSRDILVFHIKGHFGC